MSREWIIRCRETLADFVKAERRGVTFGDGYHLITPFCQTGTRSRTLNNMVMIVEKKAAIMTRAAKTLPYSAKPCDQLAYQAGPDLAPTVSATTRARNE